MKTSLKNILRFLFAVTPSHPVDMELKMGDCARLSTETAKFIALSNHVVVVTVHPPSSAFPSRRSFLRSLMKNHVNNG